MPFLIRGHSSAQSVDDKCGPKFTSENPLVNASNFTLVFRFEDAERALQSIAEKRHTDQFALIALVDENEDILDRIKANLRQVFVQAVLKVRVVPSARRARLPSGDGRPPSPIPLTDRAPPSLPRVLPSSRAPPPAGAAFGP